jgi:DNA-binding FrmR family transcriptional regulator
MREMVQWRDGVLARERCVRIAGQFDALAEMLEAEPRDPA